MINVSNELKLLEDCYQQFGDKMYVATSGGKDSTVILSLALQINPDIMLIHNPKSETHPLTIKFLYELSQKKLIHYVPGRMMEEFVKSHGLLCQIDGTRISEFTRTDKSNDVIINGQNVSRKDMKSIEQGIWGLTCVYPIYQWLDEDVFQYCHEMHLDLSEEYGDWK